MFSRSQTFLVAVACLGTGEVSGPRAGLAQTTQGTPSARSHAQAAISSPVSTKPAAVPQEGDRSSAGTSVQRRERDDLRREDMAIELARMGLPLKWQDFRLEQLTDWRDRLQAAQALRAQFGVEVDWRTQSIASLTDLRLRAAKASALSSLYGVQVDWRRYSWVALEALRRQLAKLQAPAIPVDSETGEGMARTRSGSAHRGVGFRPKDPDAILEPTFALEMPAIWAHPLGRRGRSDPDAILVPTFATVPVPLMGPDDIIDPPIERRSSSAR